MRIPRQVVSWVCVHLRYWKETGDWRLERKRLRCSIWAEGAYERVWYMCGHVCVHASGCAPAVVCMYVYL